jgi:hypothetical protein
MNSKKLKIGLHWCVTNITVAFGNYRLHIDIPCINHSERFELLHLDTHNALGEDLEL